MEKTVWPNAVLCINTHIGGSIWETSYVHTAETQPIEAYRSVSNPQHVAVGFF